MTEEFGALGVDLWSETETVPGLGLCIVMTKAECEPVWGGFRDCG